MDPNQLLAYMYSTFNPYLTAQYPQICQYQVLPSPMSQSASSVKIEEKDPMKKYHRTWKKHQVEEIFSLATKYCKDTSKTIEELTLQDFRMIAQDCEQSPEQVMNKVNEIHISGTLRPGIWSASEDELLKSLLKKGIEKWGQVANMLNKEIHKGLKIRTGKQCKERWNNYLNPDVNRGTWTEEEDICILENYKVYGNRWSAISKLISNRTESAVKNRIKSLINKIKQDLSTMDNLNIGIDRIIDKKRKNLSEKDKISSASPRSGVNDIGFNLQNHSLTFSQAAFLGIKDE